MRKVLMWAVALLATAVIAVAILLGGEPAQPKLAANGPRLEAQFERFISTSPQPVRGVRFDVSGRMLVVVGVDGDVRVLEVASGRLIRKFSHPGGATAVDLSPDGKLIATAGYDGAVRIWNLASGNGTVVPVSSVALWTLKFSPQSESLAVAGEDRLIHLFAADGTNIRTFSGHRLNIWTLAFSPDGHTIASGSFDHSLKLWAVDSGKLIRTAGEHRQAIVGLDQSHTDGLIATGGDDATLRLWRSTGEAVATKDAGQFVDAVAFSADGRWLATSGRESHGVNAVFKSVFGRRPLGGQGVTARLWRVSDLALVAGLARQSEDVVTIAFSGDESWLATGSDDGSVALWRLAPIP